MEYTRLGRAGARISRIALGTMNFGSIIDERASFALMDTAYESGVNFFDTADVYGGIPPGSIPGATEAIVGRWLRSRSVRDDIVVATKAFGRTGVGPNDRGLSAVHLRAAVDASLRRLQTDRIDLYQMHHVDRSVRPDEVHEALDRLADQGKIIYAGSSNYAGWHIARHQEKALARHGVALATEQSVYNLTRRDIETDLIPAIVEYEMGLLPWSPLGGGVLAGPTVNGARRRREPPQHLADAVRQYEGLAQSLGVRPAVLGLAWLLHQPAVTAPVVGPSRPSQLVDAVSALDVRLDEATLATLDRIWPGPSGPAPEAYAW